MEKKQTWRRESVLTREWYKLASGARACLVCMQHSVEAVELEQSEQDGKSQAAWSERLREGLWCCLWLGS